jgi:hypothetical protein
VRRFLFIAVMALTLVVAGQAAAGGFRPVPGNPADKLVKVPIDDYRYDNAKGCRKHPSKGAEAMVAWLGANAGGSFWGIMRCERWGKGRASLHAEGRAIDWHLDARNPADRSAAEQLVRLLLAPDSLGNPQALARRMGVEEMIFDCGYWGAGMSQFEKYGPCFNQHGTRRKHVDPTVGHINHIHIGLTKAGAARRTSFWSVAR